MSTFGTMGEFDSPKSLLKAAQKTTAKGFKKYDTYSPFPIHGMDDAMGLGQSKLGWIVVCCGAVGLSFGFGLQTWVSTVAYKLIIGGKPLFSYPAFIPVTFELMVLFSGFGAVFGMFALNALPKLYHAVFKHSKFSKATSDGFFLCIESSDENYNQKDVEEFIKTLGGTNIETLDD